MQRVVGRTLVVLTLAAVATADVRAQRPAAAPATQAPALPEILFGVPQSGTLAESDPKLSEGGPFHAYRFFARFDKRYVITLEARGFDPSVSVARPVGGITEFIAFGDGSGGDAEGAEAATSRLRFRPTEPGTYIIVVRAAAEDGRGAYTLRVQEVNPAVAAEPVAIRIGQTVSGTFNATSPVDDAEGYPYNVYSIIGNGQRVRVVMRSEDFDAFLIARPSDQGPGGDGELIDDDGAGGTDARLTFTVDGSFRIYARPFGNSASGTYTLSVEEARPAQVVQRTIRVGQTVEGELADGDPELDEGGYFHEYVVEASAGDELRISLRSDEFDAYLRWGTKDGSAFTELASDDDGGGDFNSLLTVRASADGRYVIRVSGLDASALGPYQLSVERGGR